MRTEISKTNGGGGMVPVSVSDRKAAKVSVAIPAPDLRVLEIPIVGTTPYMQLRFSQKAKAQMMEKMSRGEQTRKGKKREPRNYAEEFRQATYRSKQGWYGIPAPAFRAACISACRLAGFKMTIAKLSLFIIADGEDALDGTPLVRITRGKPEKDERPVRNADGSVDIRVRALWRTWAAKIRVRYDASQFSQEDVVNLLTRVGKQVGVGEGRPDSKSSAGLGFGLFDLPNG